MLYRFGAYELDIDRHELRYAGAPSPLEPQVFAVLAYLIAQRHRVVTKQDLLDHLWPAHFVSDNTLHQRLTAARRAIGDSSRTQSCIKTLRGLGYRFIATVEERAEAWRDTAGLALYTTTAAVSAGTEVNLASLAPPEVERRQLTIVCCALVDTAALADQLAPADLREMVQAYHQTCVAVMQRYGGHIAPSLGDHLLVYFGYPQAHEDDAQQAVHAGLSLLDAVETLHTHLRHEHGVRIAIRVGMHTGLMVIGERVESTGHAHLALGEAPHVADRLRDIAAPHTAVISEATYRLVAGYFTCEALGEQTLSGVAAPIAVYRVLRRSGAQNRLDIASRRGLTPLVGRQHEVALLLQRWEQVHEGLGQVVVLSGEAGIGKSRLVQVLSEHVEGAGATCITLRCSPAHTDSALYPLIQHLERLLHRDGDQTAETKLARLEHMLAPYNMPRNEVLPLFAPLLSLPPPEGSTPVPLRSQQQRQKLHDVLVAWLLAEAERHAVLMVWEDLHWADASTLEVLGRIVEQAPMARMLTLLTCRLEFHPAWASRSHLTSLTLHGLSRAQTAAMAQRVAGGRGLSAVLLEQIVTKTDGVPLFVEELTKAIVESGALRQGEGTYEVIAPAPVLAVPTTLQDSLMARLDRLGAAKGIAQQGAIIGRQFSYTLLRAVAQVDETRLQPALEQLVAAELLYQRGSPPHATYTFKHALIQDVAYQSLLVRRRQAGHRAVGDAIEALYPEPLAEHDAALAYHFTHGEVWPKAMDYSTRAGDRAAAAYANAEARAHYARALEAAGKLTAAPDAATLAQLYEKYGAILTALADAEAAVAAYQQALELMRQSGDQRRESTILAALSNVHNWYHRPELAMAYNDQALTLARQLDDRPSQAVCLIHRAAIRCVYYGQLSVTMPDAEEALRLAQELDDAKLLAQALGNLGAMLQWQGAFDRALAYLQAGAELAQRMHAGFDFGRTAFHLGIANTAQGEYDEALRWLQQLSDYATAAGDPFWLARVPNTLGGVHLEVFDFDTALRLNLEGAEAAQQYWPWPEPQAHALLKVGLAHFGRGEHGLAEAYFQRTWALLERDIFLRWRWHMPLLYAYGELALVEGRYEQAWTYATQSLEMATQTDARKHLARAQRLQGNILAARGQLAEAARTLQASLHVAAQLQTPREMWQGHAALGKVLLRLGQDKAAEASFRQALRTIEVIATHLQTPSLRHSLLQAAPILEVYAIVGHSPPPIRR